MGGRNGGGVHPPVTIEKQFPGTVPGKDPEGPEERRAKMLLHARVSLPDRPGALAALTASLASNGADIVNISVLDSDAGRVVDDVYLTCPAGHSSALFLAVACVADVDILGLRVAERPPGPLADLFLLEQLIGDKELASETTGGLAAVVDALPSVLDADWATASRAGEYLAFSLGAPGEDGELGGDVSARVRASLGATGVTITVGREKAFPFHRTEVAHLHRLLAVVAAMLEPYPAASAPAVGAA